MQEPRRARHMPIDLFELRKVATCVYLAAEASVAEDIARHIMDAADEIERLRAALKYIADTPYPCAEMAERALNLDSHRSSVT